MTSPLFTFLGEGFGRKGEFSVRNSEPVILHPIQKVAGGASGGAEGLAVPPSTARRWPNSSFARVVEALRGDLQDSGR